MASDKEPFDSSSLDVEIIFEKKMLDIMVKYAFETQLHTDPPNILFQLIDFSAHVTSVNLNQVHSKSRVSAICWKNGQVTLKVAGLSKESLQNSSSTCAKLGVSLSNVSVASKSLHVLPSSQGNSSTTSQGNDLVGNTINPGTNLVPVNLSGPIIKSGNDLILMPVPKNSNELYLVPAISSHIPVTDPVPQSKLFGSCGPSEMDHRSLPLSKAVKEEPADWHTITDVIRDSFQSSVQLMPVVGSFDNSRTQVAYGFAGSAQEPQNTPFLIKMENVSDEMPPKVIGSEDKSDVFAGSNLTPADQNMDTSVDKNIPHSAVKADMFPGDRVSVPEQTAFGHVTPQYLIPNAAVCNRYTADEEPSVEQKASPQDLLELGAIVPPAVPLTFDPGYNITNTDSASPGPLTHDHGYHLGDSSDVPLPDFQDNLEFVHGKEIISSSASDVLDSCSSHGNQDVQRNRCFRCNLCGHTTSTVGKLIIHMKTHKSKHSKKPKVPRVKNIFKCKQCPKVFWAELYLQRHMRQMHAVLKSGKKPHKCRWCEKLFCTRNYLNQHLKRAHENVNKRPCRCELCDAVFLNGHAFGRHLVKAHKELKDNHTCKTCFKTFKKRWVLINHEFIHIPEHLRPHPCTLCSRGFIVKEKLAIHMREQHTGEKPFVCDVCSKGFSCRNNLRLHSFIHSTERLFKCETCGKSFKDKSTLRKHKKTHDVYRPYLCDLCGWTSKSHHCLKKHVAKCRGPDNQQPLKPMSNPKTKETRYTRNDINATLVTLFKTISREVQIKDRENSLSSSETVSKLKNIYMCVICDKEYLTLNKVKEHVADHGNLALFTCDLCSYSCSKLRIMVKHLKNQCKNVQPKCEDCGEEFTWKIELREHQKKHKIKKSWVCDICQKIFQRQKLLKEHLCSIRDSK